MKSYFCVEYTFCGGVHRCHHRHTTHLNAKVCLKMKKSFFESRASKTPIKLRVVKVSSDEQPRGSSR